MASMIEDAIGPLLMEKKAEWCREIRSQRKSGFTMGSDIYFLTEPGQCVVRYIGESSDVANRYSKHIRDAVFRPEVAPVSRWISRLIESGQIPDVHLVARVEAYGFSYQALVSYCVAARAVEKDLVERASRGHRVSNPGMTFDLLNVEHVPAGLTA